LQAGTKEILLDNLPAYPDNVGLMGGKKSTIFTLGFAGGISKIPKSPLYRSRHLRMLLGHLPEWVVSKFVPDMAGMLGFDSSGKVLTVTADVSGKLAQSTPSAALWPKGKLVVLGNLHHDYLTVVRIG
jgi:hypothetical protein